MYANGFSVFNEVNARWLKGNRPDVYEFIDGIILADSLSDNKYYVHAKNTQFHCIIKLSLTKASFVSEMRLQFNKNFDESVIEMFLSFEKCQEKLGTTKLLKEAFNKKIENDFPDANIDADSLKVHMNFPSQIAYIIVLFNDAPKIKTISEFINEFL